MKPGRFITLEGGEGAGKSTQALMLADALRARGIDVFLTREPGGTAGAEAIRQLLLAPPGEGWGVRAEVLLFAAARADHVARAIGPALAAGRWVICDRFLDSSRAYQGAAGLTDAEVLDLHRIGSGGLLPDMTLLIEVAPTIAAMRLQDRDGNDNDAIGGRGIDYHAAVAERFAQLAERERARFARIEGGGAPAEVHERIMRAIAPLLTAGT